MKHVTAINDHEGIFMSPDEDECSVWLNSKLVQAILLNSPTAWKSSTGEFKQIQNFYLAKKSTMKSMCQVSASLQALSVLNDVPAINIDVSDLESMKVVTSKYDQSKKVEVKSVSASAAKEGSDKKTAISFKNSGSGQFGATDELPRKSSGKYNVDVTVTLSSGEVVLQSHSYFVGTTVKVDVKRFETKYAKFSLDFSKNKKVKADHVFIEIAHKDRSDVVFYKGSPTYHDGVYSFNNVKLDSATEIKGEYTVNVVVVDSVLDSEHRHKIGSLTSKKGAEYPKSQKKNSFKTPKDITHTFRKKDTDSNDPITPLVFSCAAVAILLIFLFLITSVGGNLYQFGSFWSLIFLVSLFLILGYFMLFWAVINIVQGAVIGIIAIPMLGYVIKRALKGVDMSVLESDKKNK